jgi:hypothetical protein
MVERCKQWDPSYTSEPIGEPKSNLGPAEKEILLAARDAKDGGIHILATQHDTWVRAGRANYVDKQDPAIAVAYREALQGLVSGGYVSSENSEQTYYTMTSKGWSCARDLARQPVRQLASYLDGDKELGVDKRVELLGLLSRRANLAEDFDQANYAIGELVRIMLENVLAWGIPAARELVRSHLRSGESVSQLMSALDRKEPELRRLAVWVLGRSELPEARNAIITALADPDEQVQALAFWALEKNPPEKARPSMRAIRQKLGAQVWDIAGKTLEDFGDPEAAYTSHRQCSEEAMSRLSEQQPEEMMRKGVARGMPKRME